MAEELMDILDNIRNKPVKEKLSVIENIIKKLTNITLSISGSIGKILDSFKKEINALEQRIGKIELAQTKIDIMHLNLKAPAPAHQFTPKPIPPIPTRTQLNNELTKIFKGVKKDELENKN